MKTLIIGIVGVLCFLYLLNPSLGFFEFLPDNLPLVGNIDEATATALLLSSLAYFGIDLGHIFKTKVRHVNQKEKGFE